MGIGAAGHGLSTACSPTMLSSFMMVVHCSTSTMVNAYVALITT
jgi:hypothetical protein